MLALFHFLLPSGTIPQYHMDKQFADRRYKVQSARTYFYLSEAQCERNLEIFHECLEAVSGKSKAHHAFMNLQSDCVSIQCSGLPTASHNVSGHIAFHFRNASICKSVWTRAVDVLFWVSGQKGKRMLGLGCLLSHAVMLPTISVNLHVIFVIQSCDCWQGCTQWLLYIVPGPVSQLLR